MKREFLQNFKVGDQPLTKEIIDAIMAENGRDIQNAKKPFEDYDTIKEQLAAAQTTIKGFEDQDIDGIRRSAQDWEKKYNDAIAAHEREKAELAFQSSLEAAITTAKGRNVKAISALLDVETLKKSTNQNDDIKAALEAVKKDNGYLFEEAGTPPPYSGSVGSGVGGQHTPDGVEAAFAALNPSLKL